MIPILCSLAPEGREKCTLGLSMPHNLDEEADFVIGEDAVAQELAEKHARKTSKVGDKRSTSKPKLTNAYYPVLRMWMNPATGLFEDFDSSKLDGLDIHSHEAQRLLKGTCIFSAFHR